MRSMRVVGRLVTSLKQIRLRPMMRIGRRRHVLQSPPSCVRVPLYVVPDWCHARLFMLISHSARFLGSSSCIDTGKGGR